MKLNNKRGISLIVLVITIIVMIVLAAAIILSLQSSGIIGRANEAKAKTDVANAKQVVTMAEAEWKLNEEKIKKEDNITTFKEYATKKLNEAGYKTEPGEGAYEVTENGTVYSYPIIPEGFVASKLSDEDNVSEGLVIYEMTEEEAKNIEWTKIGAYIGDTNIPLLNVHTKYNQYVWIPVENLDSFVKKDWGYGIVGETFTNQTNDYRLEVLEEKKEYNDLLESVQKYGGFYIARYEAGLPNGMISSEDNQANFGQNEGEELTIPVSMKGAEVWTYIPYDNTVALYNGSWNNPGCAKVARNAYVTSRSVVSTLIYGVQWDAALTFISKKDPMYPTNSFGKGWYAETAKNISYVRSAGYGTDLSEPNKVCNIYDMAGNAWERTMEVTEKRTGKFYHVARGGNYSCKGNEAPVAMRLGVADHSAGETYGFRITLYLK